MVPEPAPAALDLPETADGPFPSRLSEVGAFVDIRELAPAPEMIPYDLNVSFWSDGASKRRWYVPAKSGRIAYETTGEWRFPAGAVFVKHFELLTDDTHPEVRRRLETRFLVRSSTGGVFGVTYKWRQDGSDAELLSASHVEEIPIRTTSGIRIQPWYYPSREDCLTCHTPLAGGVLGVNTRQINRDVSCPDGSSENQLIRWIKLDLFENPPPDEAVPYAPQLARLEDPGRSLQDRARSWLDANCAHCHRPGGTVAHFDARYDIALEQQNLINGPVLIDRGTDNARVIAPKDIWRSMAFQRVNAVDEVKMPPIGRQLLDEEGIELLRRWIGSMDGQPVLPPPTILPGGGEFGSPVLLEIRHEDPECTIRYTLDGSAPARNSAIYNGPLTLTKPTTVRARAYRDGFTRSVVVQKTFIVRSSPAD